MQLLVDDWSRFQPVRTGLAMACTLRRLYPDDWQIDRFDALLVHRATFDELKNAATVQDLEKGWEPELRKFLQRRRQYLLYGN
jgi:uncharacterized protein YbbC (DUF1343 family)